MGCKCVYGMILMMMVMCFLVFGFFFGSILNLVMVILCFFCFWFGFGIGGDYFFFVIIMFEYFNKKICGVFIVVVFVM